MQLKCTQLQPTADGVLRFPLGVKNYNELVPSDYVVQRILVVLCVPSAPPERVMWSPESLVLRRCALWLSLAGWQRSSNKSTVQVELRDHFSPEALCRIFDEIGAGKKLGRGS